MISGDEQSVTQLKILFEQFHSPFILIELAFNFDFKPFKIIIICNLQNSFSKF